MPTETAAGSISLAAKDSGSDTKAWFRVAATDIRCAEIDLQAVPPVPEAALFRGHAGGQTGERGTGEEVHWRVCQVPSDCVLVNGEAVSQKLIETAVPKLVETWSLGKTGIYIGSGLNANVEYGTGSLRTFRRRFGLATTSVASVYQFGVADFLFLAANGRSRGLDVRQHASAAADGSHSSTTSSRSAWRTNRKATQVLASSTTIHLKEGAPVRWLRDSPGS